MTISGVSRIQILQARFQIVLQQRAHTNRFHSAAEFSGVSKVIIATAATNTWCGSIRTHARTHAYTEPESGLDTTELIKFKNSLGYEKEGTLPFVGTSLDYLHRPRQPELPPPHTYILCD